MPELETKENMTKTDRHEMRLDKHDKEICDIKEVVKLTDEKVDVIVSTTDAIATNVGKLNSERNVVKENVDGTIQKGDWRGTLAAVIGFILTSVLTAWQLYSVMFGETNPFMAALSVMMTPAMWVLIETLSGKTVKKNEIMHKLEIKENDNKHKVEVNKLKGINQMHVIEVYSLKEKVARLEERYGMKIKNASPSSPKLP